MFFPACRAQTGGQSSEPRELSDASLLPLCADSGDFPAHRNKWGVTKVRQRELGRLKTQTVSYCACMDDLTNTSEG